MAKSTFSVGFTNTMKNLVEASPDELLLESATLSATVHSLFLTDTIDQESAIFGMNNANYLATLAVAKTLGMELPAANS